MNSCQYLTIHITHGSQNDLRLKTQLEHDLSETLTLNNHGPGLDLEKTLWSSHTCDCLDNCMNHFFHCNSKRGNSLPFGLYNILLEIQNIPRIFIVILGRKFLLNFKSVNNEYNIIYRPVGIF